MKTRHVWPAYATVAVIILVAVAMFLPTGGAASPYPNACRTTHVVLAYQTSSSIAAMYGVSLQDLVAANHLYNPNHIYIGQKLCIPAEGAAVPADDEEITDGNLGICVTGQVIDKAHNGLAGLTVTAELGQSIAINTITDEDGMFGFDELVPGEWTFRVAVPDSWHPVTPAEFSVELNYGHGTCYPVRFKLEPLGCLIVNKTDANGYPLADWLITATGAVDPEGYTDENGTVRFTELTPGPYVVSEEVPYPWTALTPASVTVDVAPAMDDDDCTVVDFVNERQPTSCIIGQKVDDAHNGLPGWEIYAESADGHQVGPVVTDENGYFIFEDLTLGTWTVSEDVQDWWTPITPAQFSVQLLEESVAPYCVEVRFKNRAPDLCAEGYKVDENGVGLSGWTVRAYPESDPTMVMETTTDSHGHYRFNGLTLGNWIFEVEGQTGWTPINADMVKVDIEGSAYCTQVPVFRNHSPEGCVEGYKRDDLQVGLPGWNISLDSVDGGMYMHADTDGTGYFRFDNLPVGEYEVWEEMQSGWTPLTPTEYVVEVEAADPDDQGLVECKRVEFVNKQVERDICIDGYKLDVNGRVGLPGWLITATNLDTADVLEATTNGLGYFRFGGLEPGDYEVSVTEVDDDDWEPVGASSQVVTVSWPPKLDCTPVYFYNRQIPTDEPFVDGCRYRHTVQRWQTLLGLAAWYGVPYQTLMNVNGIYNPDMIYVGQELCIP